VTLEQLDAVLKKYEKKLKPKQKALLAGEVTAIQPVFPFNTWEYRFNFLLEHGCMSFVQYEELRSKYIAGNPYLNLYGLAPRIFGEIWGQEHIREIDDRFQPASRANDAGFDGEYDLILGNVKIEVKAARAIDTKLRGDLVSKALRRDAKEPYWMNFQQLKPNLCDVFIFIGVWVDQIVYWILSSAEVKASPYVSSQHRGGIEMQIGIKPSNLASFAKFAVPRDQIAAAVIRKAKRKARR